MFLYLCVVEHEAMYQALTFYHSFVRWLVVASLLFAIYRAYKGFSTRSAFTKTDNAIRHWTATIAHIQLVIGIILYSQSPLTSHFWKHYAGAVQQWDAVFFNIMHPLLMLVAIVVVTIGSALAKRKQRDVEQFRTMLIWFTIAFVIIFIAIPWPFSPLANRPYLR